MPLVLLPDKFVKPRLIFTNGLPGLPSFIPLRLCLITFKTVKPQTCCVTLGRGARWVEAPAGEYGGPIWNCRTVGQQCIFVKHRIRCIELFRVPLLVNDLPLRPLTERLAEGVLSIIVELLGVCELRQRWLEFNHGCALLWRLY